MQRSTAPVRYLWMVAASLFAACASAPVRGRLHHPEARPIPRAIEILFTGDMRGKIEPCG